MRVFPKKGYPKMDDVFHGSKPYEQMDALGGYQTPIFGSTPMHFQRSDGSLTEMTLPLPRPSESANFSRLSWHREKRTPFETTRKSPPEKKNELYC